MEKKRSDTQLLSGAPLPVKPIRHESEPRVADGIKLQHILRLANEALQNEKANSANFQKRNLPQRDRSHRAHTNRGLPLCYEHHIEMKRIKVIANGRDRSARMPSYACLEPSCTVSYNRRWGYVMRDEHSEREVMPRVICPRDGRPMYLAEVRPKKTSFRLWRCSKCGTNWINE
jgi:hypothetical protein